MQNIVIKYVIDPDSQLSKARESSVRTQKATDDLRKSTQAYGKEVKTAGDNGQKAFSQISTAIKSISFVLIAKELLDFTKQVISVRGEFQKFEAVLTNTLGSKSAALIALGRINEFAKSTPFGVKELTDNFIKLANRGIQPTVQQMRAIADLSATLGKDFSQVVEAILDINNPERWKEIGIKAETAGNKVKLTFRGVTEEVDRTVEGVTGAVVALGKLNGVAGSTEAISRTLSGQTSNLNDAWEQLLNTIGKGNEGVLFDAVSLLSQAIEKANDLLKGTEQRFEELQAKTLAAEVEGFEKLAAAMGDATTAADIVLGRSQEKLKQIRDRFAQIRATLEESSIADSMSGEIANINLRNKAREEEMLRLRMLEDIYSDSLPQALSESIKKINEKAEADKKAADAATAKAAADRAAELAERRRGSGGGGAPLKQVVEYDLKDPVTGEVKKLDRDAVIKAFEGLTANVQGEIPPIKQPIEIVPMDDWDKISEMWEDNWKDVLSQGINDTGDFLMGIQEAELESFRTRIDNLKSFYSEQQLLAGDNERAKKELRIKEEREVAKIQAELALKEWKAKRNSILLSTAGGIARAFIDYQWPYALIPAAAVAAQGAVQLGIADRNKPRFAKGVIALKGPGSETSDSIDAKLSRGESVMTAKETREAFGILTEVRAGKLNDKILRQIVYNGGSQAFDDSRIIAAIDNQPKPPDIVRIHKEIYEVTKSKDGSKKFIRSKSI